MLETPKAADTANVTIPSDGPQVSSLSRLIGTMDNQQATDWAYLAGLVDGEGCISICPAHKKGGSTQLNVSLHVLNNTNAKLIDWVAETLARYDIPHYVYWAGKRNYRNSRPCGLVALRRRTGIKKFLLHVLPYLVGKRRQAELLLEFVESRITVFETAQRNSESWTYKDRDFEITRQIKALNQRGLGSPNDYTLDKDTSAQAA